MRVAILIPVYNAQRYLHECLDSALTAGDELERTSMNDAYEIFCCDDGSTDDSLSILRKYEARYNNVHVVVQSNAGVSVARNRLIDELPDNIDAFAFLDADDYVARDMYVKLVDAMRRTNADVAECEWTGPETVLEDMSIFLLKCTSLGRWINVINKFYLRDAVGKIRFRNGLCFEEDYFFNFEVHQQIRRKVLVPGHYYTYRTNPNSATNSLDCRRYFESACRRIRLSCDEYLRTGRIPKALESEFCEELTKDLYRMCIRKNLKKNKDVLLRRKLFLEATDFINSPVFADYINIKGLNLIQRFLFRSCQSRHFSLARLVALLT